MNMDGNIKGKGFEYKTMAALYTSLCNNSSVRSSWHCHIFYTSLLYELKDGKLVSKVGLSSVFCIELQCSVVG